MLVPMKKIYLFFILMMTTLLVSAQQTSMYSHYYFKPMVYNPAFTGSDDAINAMLISRNQWTGFKGGPRLNIFTLDGSINDKAGLGVALISDRKGLLNRVGGNVSYSYRLKLNDDMQLAFGLNLGVVDQTVDFSKALVENNMDPTLFATAEHSTAFDANAGVAFKWKELSAGLAVPQLMGNKIKYVDNSDVRFFYTQARHYMASAKYKVSVMEDKGITATPLVLLRVAPHTPTQFDGAVNVGWQDKLWVGATYKSSYAVGFNVGVCVQKQLTVGYSYDFITGKIGKYSGASHEIMINFKFGKRSNKVDTIVSQPFLPLVVEQPTIKTLENKDYENRMDSLQNQLKESQENLRKLSEKLEEQLTAKQTANTDNRNNEAIESNANKVLVEGVWVITNKTNEFKDDQNHEPEKGFYVVVGTFVYHDLAVAETRRFHEKGFKTANWVFYDVKKYNYVFTERSLSKQVALLKAKAVRENGVKDVWIQELIKEEKAK